jgi:GntR family transcriptional repressor for pyruvate dehydrogenase complex
VRKQTAKVTPLSRTTLTTAAFEQLISNVVNGTWKTGERLPPERELCQQLGIARTSLREALKAMELIGMLNSKVGDGTFVCPRSEFLSRPMIWALMGIEKAELHDVMEARIIMEESSAGLAAERATDAQIEDINKAVQAMRDAIARDEPVLEADMQFHLAISNAAGNPLLANSLMMLRNSIRQGMLYKHLLPGISAKIVKAHAAVYNAITRRDASGAKKAMRTHLLESMRLVDIATKKYHSKLRLASKKRKLI